MPQVTPFTKVMTKVFVNQNAAEVARDWHMHKELLCFILKKKASTKLNVPLEAFEDDLTGDPADTSCWVQITKYPDGRPVNEKFIFSFGFRADIYGRSNKVTDIKLEFGSWFGDSVITSEKLSVYDTDSYDEAADECLQILDQHLFKMWREA